MGVKEIKEAVRNRDGRKCVDCGMTEVEWVNAHKYHSRRTSKRLDVHRINPTGEYSFENCVTLCRSCHCHRRRDYILVGVVKGRKRFRMTNEAVSEMALRKWLRASYYQEMRAAVRAKIAADDESRTARANGRKKVTT